MEEKYIENYDFLFYKSIEGKNKSLLKLIPKEYIPNIKTDEESIRSYYKSGNLFNIKYSDLVTSYQIIDYWFILYNVCEKGYINIIKYLDENSEAVFMFSNEIVSWACEKGQINIIKYMMKYRNDCDINNILIYASVCGQLDVIKCLILNGADIHYKDDKALKKAGEYGNYDVVDFLVQNGADIHAQYDYALRHSVGNSQLKTTEYLLEHGADIHAFDDYVLRTAVRHNNFPMVKLLVEHGADINIKNNGALRIAREKNNLEIEEYLKAHNTRSL